MRSRRDVTFEDCLEVAVEIQALDEYRQLIPMCLRPDSELSAFLNPLLDAIAIHSRALIDFFYGRPGGRARHPDDLHAADFVDGWDCQLPDRLAAHVKLLDKHLAHITLRRSDDRAQGMIIDVGPVADEVLDVAADFAGRLTRWTVTPGTWIVSQAPE